MTTYTWLCLLNHYCSLLFDLVVATLPFVFIMFLYMSVFFYLSIYLPTYMCMFFALVLQGVMCTQKPSSRYLDGKRKQATNSKFRLILPADEDPYLVTARRQFSLSAGPSSTYSTFGPSTMTATASGTSNGGMGGAATTTAAGSGMPNVAALVTANTKSGKGCNNPFIGRNKSKLAKSTLSLYTCLQDPANVSAFSHPTMENVVASASSAAANTSKCTSKNMFGGTGTSGLGSLNSSLKQPSGALSRGQSTEKLDRTTESLDIFSGTGEPKMTLKDGCYNLHRNELLADWQNFCVDIVTETKTGAQKSMPILGRVVNKVGGDVKGVDLKGSSKGGKLVATESLRDYEVHGPSSYLELHTAKQQDTHSYKQGHHHYK